MNEIIQNILSNSVFVGLSGASALGMVVWLARRFPSMIWRWFLAGFSVSMDVNSDVNAFQWIQRWLAEHPYSKRARRLLLIDGTDRHGEPTTLGYDEDGFPQYEEAPPQFILTPADGFHVMMYGHRILTANRGKGEKGANGMPGPDSITLRLFARNRDPLNKLVREAYELCNRDSRNHLVVMMRSHGRWYTGARQQHRMLETVVLDDGVSQRIVEDAKEFRSKNKWYLERGIPWRRGYLLYGPPGCGKSSFVAAMASHLGMSVALLNLADILTEGEMVDSMRSQPKNSILLIEDVDAAFKKRDNKNARTSFSTLLNAIDGIAAPDGRILVMTTNHVEDLDPALIRPGRIDMQVKFDVATHSQAERLFMRFFPNCATATANAFANLGAGLSPATLQEILLRNADSAPRAVADIGKMRMKAA